MSKIYVTSDLHLGHKNINKFRKLGENSEEHDKIIMDNWNAIVKKRDVVYVLGDVAFSTLAIAKFSKLNGTKILVRGNHDKLDEHWYRESFKSIQGLYKKHGAWFSHAPIHPDELWSIPNIHGHVHSATINDNRYFNACLENTDFKPVLLDDILKIIKRTYFATDGKERAFYLVDGKVEFDFLPIIDRLKKLPVIDINQIEFDIDFADDIHEQIYNLYNNKNWFKK